MVTCVGLIAYLCVGLRSALFVVDAVGLVLRLGLPELCGTLLAVLF